MLPHNLPINIYIVFLIEFFMVNAAIIAYCIYAIFLTLSQDARMNFAGIFMFLGLFIKLL